MKKTKVLIFVFVALVASFILSSNVFAFKKGEYIGHDYYSDVVSIKDGVKKNNGKQELKFYLHHTEYNKKNYLLYCLDAARISGGSNANLIVDRVLDPEDPKDAVILSIMGDTNYSQAVKTIAIRAYIPLVGDLSADTSISTDKYKTEAKANANSGVIWAASDPTSTKKIFGLKTVNVDTVAKMSDLYGGFNKKIVLNEDKKEVKQAKALFLKALKYAADTADGVSPHWKKVEYKDLGFDKDREKVDTKNNVTKRTFEFELRLVALMDEADPVTLSVSTDASDKITIESIEYSIYDHSKNTEGKWQTYKPGTDLRKKLSYPIENIKVRVNVSSSNTINKSFKFKYNVKLNYTDGKELYGALLRNKNNTTNPTQRFYIYDEEPLTHDDFTKQLSWKIPDKPSICATETPKRGTDGYDEYINNCCRDKQVDKSAGEKSAHTQCKEQEATLGKDKARSTNACIAWYEDCNPTICTKTVPTDSDKYDIYVGKKQGTNPGEKRCCFASDVDPSVEEISAEELCKKANYSMSDPACKAYYNDCLPKCPINVPSRTEQPDEFNKYIQKDTKDGCCLISQPTAGERSAEYLCKQAEGNAKTPDELEQIRQTNEHCIVYYKYCQPTQGPQCELPPNKDNTNEWKNYIKSCCRNTGEKGAIVVDECEKATKNKDQAGINKWCKLKEEYCDPCNTNIDVPETCAEFSEAQFKEGKSATISGPTNVKVCVMDNLDESNQSYKLTKDVKLDKSVDPGESTYTFTKNKYCSVSCKEDYQIGLPAGRYTISGRYFTLKMGISATKTCYTDLINNNLFKTDIDGYRQTLKMFIDEGTANRSNSEFVTTLKNYEDAIKDIKACSAGWNNNYSVDPLITYEYQEDYIKQVNKNELKFVKQKDEKVTTTKWFCDGSDVDVTYNNCIGAKATNTVPTYTYDGVKCELGKDGQTYKCEYVKEEIPTTRYAKVSTTSSASYTPESIFYTKYSTGVIKLDPTGTKFDSKYTLLEEELDSQIDDSIKIKSGGLAVQLKDPQGVYNYSLKFDKVGEYFDKKGAGRILGGKNAVALKSNDVEFKGTYVCAYVVNCPECNVDCLDDPKNGFFCTIDEKSCPPEGCDVACVGTCAYDTDNGNNFTVHQTSITNFNAEGRDLGPNLTTDKGKALIDSINTNGEKIYNDPEYSFTFTPAAISFLRDKVNANSSDGYLGSAKGYDMDCKLYSDLTGDKSIKGTKEDYTICTSKVLDHLQDLGAVKVHTLEDTRDKIMSWKDSDYCKNGKYSCVLVGNVGPAWK